jgi:WD40 repeat protein
VSKIFVSYSSKDSKVANQICAALEAKGLACWIASRDINPGENFGEAIVNAIRAAKLMLLVFTQNANNSDEIKKELVLAGQNRLIVVPVRVEDVVPGGAFAYELATRQWIDLFEDWDRAIERLATWIQTVSKTPVVAPVPMATEIEDDLARTLTPDSGAKQSIAPVPTSLEEVITPPPLETPSPPTAAPLATPVRPLPFSAAPALEQTASTRRRILRIGGALAGIAAVGGGTTLELQPGHRLWRLLYDKSIRTYEGHTDTVRSVAFLPDGRTALSGSFDQTLALWDVASGTRLRSFRGHYDRVTSIAVSPDGRTAVSGSADKTIRLWDVATGQQRREFDADNYVWSVAVAPGGRIALSGGEGTFTFWDLNGGDLIRTVTVNDYVYSAAFSRDGLSVLTSGRSGAVRLWSVATGREIRAFEGHSDWVYSVAFSPDGHIAASGSNDRTIKLWNVATGEELRTLAGPASYVFSVVFTPDGGTLLSGDGDNVLRFWDVGSGRELRAFAGHSGTVLSVTASPDGRFVLSGSADQTLKLWDLSGKA